ncbi:hypothetical protein [Portibacter marinus]|uniref:hypothetical protein n=1 Tax=Portibacter marinus TaxID=2898660 RepID=UPI001F2B0845|nr:hypothetical protein [Portibacter marinus]
MNIDYTAIIKKAWEGYGDIRSIKKVTNISVEVSTNAVYKIDLDDRNILFAKLSYFGMHEAFSNDHVIINALSNNLGLPFDGFLARSLMKGRSLYIYRYKDADVDASLVFYLPVKINKRPPRRLDETQIVKLARSIAHFHLCCNQIRKTLPESNKDIFDDIRHLKRDLSDGHSHFSHNSNLVKEQISIFLSRCDDLHYRAFNKIPVFLDWNIGNFSVSENFALFSRWDYDWFRVDSRILDFYFLARVVSNIGDQTVFHYNFDILKEDRFLLFLKNYHEVFPLDPNELHFIKEGYRFFILNYVVREGRRFFHDDYSYKLQSESYQFLPHLDDQLDTNIYLKKLNL